MPGRLEGKVCVVTGSAGRIGQGIVDKFLAAGAVVVGIDIIEGTAAGVDHVKCDLGSAEAIKELEKSLTDKYGRIDVLVNNGALGGHRCAFHEKPLDEYTSVMDINVRAPFLLSQLAIRMHLASNQAAGADANATDISAGLSIINIASIAAHRAAPLASVYGISKHALVGLTKTVAAEYADKGVRCNSISPGIMEVPNIQGFSDQQVDDMHKRVPMRRGGRPSEVGDLAVFLASDESSYISGEDILLDGGLRNGSF